MKLCLHTRYQNSAGQRVRIVLNLKQVPYGLCLGSGGNLKAA